MLNSTSQSAITDLVGSDLTECDAGKGQLGAIAVVQSFLDTLQNDKHRDSSISMIINGKDDALGILPTLPELLDSSAALQKRLLNNPGVSEMAIIEIFRLNDLESDQSMPTSSSRGALVGCKIGGDIEVAIDRKAKARVIFSKMCDPSCPLNPDDVICKLNEYLESSRSEAVVKQYNHLSID
ncbi:hypothetical protein BGX21_008180 [Mortierella sp. AD011]|nr:hypothetical protein BGX21_008180 [Mortierella sp. AD011]